MGPTGVTFGQITDGLSNTFLVGEKHVPWGHFKEAWWDCSIYDGHNWPCSCRSAGVGFPLADDIRDLGWKFGSYHTFLCQFAFADGSVRPVSTHTSQYVLGLLANRGDGQAIPDF